MNPHVRNRRRVPAVLLALLCAVALAAAPTGARAASGTSPTAREQLAWVLDATQRQPVGDRELRRHVSAPALKALGGTTAVNGVLAAVADSRLRYRTPAPTGEAKAVIRAGDGADYLLTVTVDAGGLIDSLFLAARPAPPSSWTAVDRQLRTLAPQVSFTTSRIGTDGSCRRVHGLDPAQPRALGSAFKLYVLGALGRAVSRHTAAWSESLAIRDAWKSLPSGVLQDRPAGTTLTLAQYADYMISISDNTAADHLVHRLGRRAVQHQLVRFGNAHPQLTTPFPTTRELFALKGFRYPSLATAYVGSPRALKSALLQAADTVPRSGITAWTQPRDIGSTDGIEWFGSPDDMCRAFAGLQRQAAGPGMSPIARALSINDGNLALNPTRYPTVWFKGGSEPGVLTLNYLVRDADGSSLVSSVMLSDPDHALDETSVIPAAQAIIRGSLALAR